MRHALYLPIFGELAEPGTVATLAAQAEQAGWDGLFVWDHVVYGPRVHAVGDPWITLAAVACATSSLRLGPMVTPLPRRRPVTVAAQAAALDRLSGGRLTLGVGIAGDGYRELSGTGEQTDPRVRAAQLDEALTVLAGVWSGQPVRHRGEHYTVDDLAFGPGPVQRPGPPVWVGARHGNPAPLRRAARHEGVFPIGLEHPGQLAELVAQVHEMRAPQTGPFDVAVTGPAGADPTPWGAAGATWWLTGFSPFEVTTSAVGQVVQAGPPRP